VQPSGSDMYGYFLLPCKIVVRCKNEFFLEIHLSAVFNILYLQKTLVYLLLSSPSTLIPCKFVEPTHNRSI
jgi:hypothetical protein